MEEHLFHDREQELAALERWRAEQRTQLIVIYGKRRVGKTQLIRRFLQDQPGVYFLATQAVESEQLRALAAALAERFDDAFLGSRGFGSWDEVFAYLRGRAQGLVLAIDEYPCLVEANRAISSVFQKGFDEQLADSGIFLILCGSSVGMMETEVLDVRAPLYGRRTGQLRVESFPFPVAQQLLAGWSPADRMRAYATVGGTPAYLARVRPERSYRDNVLVELLDPTSYLYSEPELLLRQELREPRVYLSILRAIAAGKRKLAEVANETGLSKSSLGKYLSVLQELRLIERELPVTELQPDKSKRGRYRIVDPFLRFAHTFVLPNRSYLERRMASWVWEHRIAPRLDALVSAAFEDVCAQLLREHAERLGIPWVHEHLGRWWHAGEEIDLVGFDDAQRCLLLAECKWSRRRVGTNVLVDLRAKQTQVERTIRATPGRVVYALMSRSGFTNALLRSAGDEVLLLDYRDLLGD